MFQGILNTLSKLIYVQQDSRHRSGRDEEPMGIDHIGKLPNEILTQILDYLPMEEKLGAALVCKKWRNQVYENVTFDVQLSDKNFNQVGRRLQARRVKSLHISNYSHPTIPIEELFHLKTLHLWENVSESALYTLFTRAVNLNSLTVGISRRPGNGRIISEENSIENSIFPALLNLKYLNVGSYYDGDLRRIYPRAWNIILDAHMPNIEYLDIDLFDPFPFKPILGFDFFRLASSKPKLRKSVFLPTIPKKYSDGQEIPEVEDHPLTPAICEGLQKLSDLTHVGRIVRESDETAWKILLSGQHRLESLELDCDWFFSNETRGYSLSILHPVLKQSRDSLHTLALEIDTKKNGNVLDMKLFSQLKSLRVLQLHVWKKYRKDFVRADASLQPKVLNCETAVQPKLKRLRISGFKFGKEDANNVIKKIAELDLLKVEINSGNQPTWNNFEQRVREMGIDKAVPIIGSVSASSPNQLTCSWHYVEFKFLRRLL